MPSDPKDLLHESYNAWERQANKFFEQLSRDPYFLQWMGDSLQRALRLKVEIDRATQTTLAAMGLPTKTDQDKILYIVQTLEDRLNDLRKRLAELVQLGES